MSIIQSLYGEEHEYKVNGATYIVSSAFKHTGRKEDNTSFPSCVKRILTSDFAHLIITEENDTMAAENVDDGYTGTNFERPGFQKMIEDIDLGYISTVIVKDLSRLGRRYDMVGYYMDTYFPDRDVRFIAVNDNIDSDEGESEIAPFKNVLNEFYARDISKKCRSSYRIRGSTGEPLAPPPYGYIKSPDNPKKWIIDPEAAQVVRDIFKMALEGKSNETIARILQERKVLIPMAYWREKGIRKGGKVTQPNKYKWCKTTVTKILTQQEYCGDIINFKTYSKSCRRLS